MCLSANEADLEKNPNDYGVFTLKTTNVNFPSTLRRKNLKKTQQQPVIQPRSQGPLLLGEDPGNEGLPVILYLL